jgi:hypothetical protein
MVGYTILRAAIVWRTLEDYGVNPWIFLAIDIVTVPPYVWGIGKMVQGLRGVNPLRVVYAGGVVAIAAFVAPYGYMYLAGHAAMPMSTKVIVGVIIVALFTAGPIREVIKKVKNGKACSV